MKPLKYIKCKDKSGVFFVEVVGITYMKDLKNPEIELLYTTDINEALKFDPGSILELNLFHLVMKYLQKVNEFDVSSETIITETDATSSDSD